MALRTMASAVELHSVSAGYGETVVLEDINLSIAPGESISVIGRNGVGKTTLVSAVMGLLRPYRGSIYIEERDHARRRPDAIAKAGVALVPQGRRVFAPLTVAEHLAIAARRTGQWDRGAVLDLLPRLGERLKHRGDQLSGGEQQMLAIARALLSNPRLLLLDEPSDGLAPAVVAQVADVVRSLCSTGMSVLLVEQNLRLAFTVSDRVTVMDKGRIVLDTTTADFRSDAARAHSLLGVG